MTRSFLVRMVFSISTCLFFNASLAAKGVSDSSTTVIPLFKPNCFIASLEKDQAVLQWVTDPAPGTSHYVIEYSVTGSFFSPLVSITAGASDSYLYKHTRVGKEPFHYYRIKKVNKDGTVSRSHIRIVRFP